jgi:choline kinase
LKAIILNAGQGKRLLPLTQNVPKCLLRLGGCTVLEWQLRMLAVAGVDRVVVVAGFGAVAVERQLAAITIPGLHVRTLFNPLHDRADNILSCLVAVPEMDQDFLLLNGDTLADPVVITRMLDSPATPVAMAIAQKNAYDTDDMKVCCDGATVRRVGKDLAADDTHGEAIGFSLYRGRGPELFAAALSQVLSNPESTARWYLSAVDVLAGAGHVDLVAVGDARYAEIDYAHDLPRARALVARLAPRLTPVTALRWTGTGSTHASYGVRTLRAAPRSGSAP